MSDIIPINKNGETVTVPLSELGLETVYELTEAGIARICHEVNRAYCESLGDHSQPPWEEAPEWQRDSAVAGVQAHLEQPRSPAKSHELWLKTKQAEGWRWGLKKDATKKTHPCMVPFDQLSQTPRAKDYLFSAVVAGFRSARA